MSSVITHDFRGRIVVGIDGSEPSKAALRWAARVGAGLDIPIDVVHVWHIPAEMGVAGISGASVIPADWSPEGDARARSQEALSDVFGDAVPGGLRLHLEEGDPAHALVTLSEDAEMLVVGASGHGGILGALRGSVSKHCAVHAVCPVVIVPGPTT